MGLLLYFAHPEDWELRYNCSFYSVDSIPLEQRVDRRYSVIVIILFATINSLYVPCLCAMCTRAVRSAFCYKLMFLMGVFDVSASFFTTLLPAYFSWNGQMFCSSPRLIYFACTTIWSLWNGYCVSAVILSINRCLWTSKWRRFFEDPEVQWSILSIPLGTVVFVAVFCEGTKYNAVHGTWYFNPHLGYFDDVEGNYVSYLEAVNLCMTTAIPLIYAAFFIQNYVLSRSRMSGMPLKEYQLFLQTLLISLTIVIVAGIFLMMQFIPSLNKYSAVVHILWVTLEGAPALIYLTMNRTIRRVVFPNKSPIHIHVTNSESNYTGSRNLVADSKFK